MAIANKMMVGGLVVAAAVTCYARRRHARTGEGYVAIIGSLPSDARVWWGKVRQHAALALEDGRAAAREREAELSRQLASVDG